MKTLRSSNGTLKLLWLFCNSPLGRNISGGCLQRADIARKILKPFCYSKDLQLSPLCTSSTCWTNGEPHEEKPADPCQVCFPVPHTAVVITQHRDSYHTANHNNIVKERKKSEAERDLNTITLCHIVGILEERVIERE